MILPLLLQLAVAQLPPERPAQHIWVAEREVSERWMNARQRPEFTRPSFERQWLNVTTENSNGEQPNVSPAARFWELVHRFAPKNARINARWTDTLDLRAGRGENTEALGGFRFNRIVGDTTVDGRRLWIVRDSAQVEYTTRVGDREPGLNSLGITTRTVRGAIRGRYLYDAEFGIVKVNTDTTKLRGVATLTYANGQTFHSPTRFERTRKVTLYDSAAYKARQAALKASEPPFEVVFVPMNDRDDRLARGDTVFRDSLLAVLRNSKDSSARTVLAGALHGWGASREFQERVNRVILAEGDTNYYLNELSDMVVFSRMTLAQVQFALPFMRDPGLQLAFGRERESFYEEVASALLRKPPALISDSASWPCTPDACKLLATQWRYAKEPRLRLVGLIANFTMDPKRWLDTMRVYVNRAGFAHASLDLINGVGTTEDGRSKQEIPKPNSSWREWLNWTNGEKAQQGVPIANIASHFQFDTSRLYATRMQQKLFGRDVVPEWRRGYAIPNDTAKFVFGSLLLATGELSLSAEQIASMLQNQSNPPGRDLAKRALSDVFRGAETADAGVTTELADSLLAMLIDGAPSWPDLNGSTTAGSFVPMISHGSVPLYLGSKRLPDVVRARWGSRMRLITETEQGPTRTVQPVIEITIDPIEVAGTLARITVSWFTLENNFRSMGGVKLYMLRTERGWVVVRDESWIT